jgi:hypothetical protein
MNKSSFSLQGRFMEVGYSVRVKSLFRFRPVFALILLSLLPLVAVARTLVPGDALLDLDGEDQHEVVYAIPDSARYVAIAFTMGVGKDANRFLEKKGAAYLPEHNAVFIANIHGMPGVGRVFALPKMRKYPHRILLADQEGLLDDIPEKDGLVTVLELSEDGRIAEIRFWDPEDAESTPFGTP